MLGELYDVQGCSEEFCCTGTDLHPIVECAVDCIKEQHAERGMEHKSVFSSI